MERTAAPGTAADRRGLGWTCAIIAGRQADQCGIPQRRFDPSHQHHDAGTNGVDLAAGGSCSCSRRDTARAGGGAPAVARRCRQSRPGPGQEIGGTQAEAAWDGPASRAGIG